MVYHVSEKDCKRILMESLDGYCYSGLHALRYYSLDHLMERLREIVTQSVPDSSPHETFNINMKQSYRSISEKRRQDDGNHDYFTERLQTALKYK